MSEASVVSVGTAVVLTDELEAAMKIRGVLKQNLLDSTNGYSAICHLLIEKQGKVTLIIGMLFLRPCLDQ